MSDLVAWYSLLSPMWQWIVGLTAYMLLGAVTLRYGPRLVKPFGRWMKKHDEKSSIFIFWPLVWAAGLLLVAACVLWGLCVFFGDILPNFIAGKPAPTK